MCLCDVYVRIMSIYQYITYTHISNISTMHELNFPKHFLQSTFLLQLPSRNYHPSSLCKWWRWAQGAKPVRTPWKSVPFEAGRWQKGCWIGGCLGVVAPFLLLKSVSIQLNVICGEPFESLHNSDSEFWLLPHCFNEDCWRVERSGSW